jgi:hypothetical protein
MSGIVRPESSAAVNTEAVQLASGWILLGVGIVLVIFIVLFKGKIGKKPELEKIIDSISPRIVNNYKKAAENLGKALEKKGLPNGKIDDCFNILRKGFRYS